MALEGPSNLTSQGSVTPGLWLSLLPRRSVLFETTLVPLPSHHEPHPNAKRKETLKVSQPISRQHAGGRPLPPQVDVNGGRY